MKREGCRLSMILTKQIRRGVYSAKVRVVGRVGQAFYVKIASDVPQAARSLSSVWGGSKNPFFGPFFISAVGQANR
jgi:hypothetical protein